MCHLVNRLLNRLALAEVVTGRGACTPLLDPVIRSMQRCKLLLKDSMHSCPCNTKRGRPRVKDRIRHDHTENRRTVDCIRRHKQGTNLNNNPRVLHGSQSRKETKTLNTLMGQLLKKQRGVSSFARDDQSAVQSDQFRRKPCAR